MFVHVARSALRQHEFHTLLRQDETFRAHAGGGCAGRDLGLLTVHSTQGTSVVAGCLCTAAAAHRTAVLVCRTAAVTAGLLLPLVLRDQDSRG